ncbi:MAG: hypothetical protein EPO02_03120 [Nitrospirae bacterium]|nr:MAG: hypothetical protein EPO02_03120 [Nitrospirota bacterium]
MNFVKIQNYYINLDRILYVQDAGENLFISFKNAQDLPITIFVKKTEPDGVELLASLQGPSV